MPAVRWDALRLHAMRLRPLEASEAPHAARRTAISMGAAFDEQAVERWRSLIAAGQVWGLEHDDEVLGHTRLLPTEHRFGGDLVSCLDIAGVVVPPEHRRRGVASAMMRQAIAAGTAQGHGLSLLFPATTALYRGLGWELAGTRTRYRVRTRFVPPDGAVMRPADRDSDWAAVKRCREDSLRAVNGPAVRSGITWARLAEVEHRYVLDTPGEPGAIDAYALFDLRTDPGDWQHTLVIADWATRSAAGLQAVAGLVGRSASFGRHAELVDTVPSRWLAVLPEQDLEHAGGLEWMARALDFGAAVAARGFPRGLAAAVTLGVGEHAWRLEIAGGRGQLMPAAGAEVRFEQRGLGPLFTGYRSARELALLGLAQGPEQALAVLDAAFAGPPPVMFDFF